MTAIQEAKSSLPSQLKDTDVSLKGGKQNRTDQASNESFPIPELTHPLQLDQSFVFL